MRPRPDRHDRMRPWRVIAALIAVAACLMLAVLPTSVAAPVPAVAQGAAGDCDGTGHGPAKAVPACCSAAACPMFAAVPAPILRVPEPVRPVAGVFRAMSTLAKDGAGQAPPYRPPRPAV